METLYQFTSKQTRFSISVISRRWSTRHCIRNWQWGNGVEAIIERLNGLFEKDSKITKYQALEEDQQVCQSR